MGLNETVEYIIEIEQGDFYEYIVDSVISYSEFPADGFHIKLKKEMYPELTSGMLDAYLYVGTPTTDPIMKAQWTVELQELFE